MKKVLVINPGSTSTKVAYYEDKEERLNKNVFHETSELSKFATIADQYDYRLNLIQSF